MSETRGTTRFELITTLDFGVLSRPNLDEVAERLEAAIVVDSLEFPMVSAYFVSIDTDSGESLIDVGLRFEGIPGQLIEETAAELLGRALVRVEGDRDPEPGQPWADSPAARAMERHRDSFLLVPA